MSGNFINSPLDAVHVQNTNAAGLATLIGAVTANIPNAVPGYATGCICTDETTGLGYSNTGSGTSCTFTAFSSASALTLPSAFTDSTTTTGNAMEVTASAITTGKIFEAINGNAANFTTGAALFYGDMGVATAGNGLVIVGTGVYTGTGLVTLTNNALTTGKLILGSATGQTSGTLVSITGGGANITTGIVVDIEMGAAIAGTGLKVLTSGALAGSNNMVLFSAAAATTSTGIVRITATGLTSGTALYINAVTETLTTGKYLEFYNGTTNDFTVSKYGATVIAGTAIGTASLTQTAGDHVMTSGNLILTAGHIKNTPQAIVNANTAISIVTLGTTIANNAASTHTLADGTVGQLKYIVCSVYTGDAVITPANFVGTTITLNAAGDSWLGVFEGTEWTTLALGGTAAVA